MLIYNAYVLELTGNANKVILFIYMKGTYNEF